MASKEGRKSLIVCNLIVAQSATNTYAFRYSLSEKDPDTGDDVVTPVDLTDEWTAHAQLRKIKGGDVWIDLTDTDGIRLSNDGGIYIIITPEKTESDLLMGFTKTTYGVWDLKLKDKNGEKVPFVEGTVQFEPSVTRSS